MSRSRCPIIPTLIVFLTVTALCDGAEPPPPRFEPVEFAQPSFAATQFSVSDYGAKGDGETRDTAAINAAINACNAAGGGTVYFPKGTYKVASVRLRSNVRLLLHDQAVIIGAKDGYEKSPKNPFDKYQDNAHSYFRNAVIYGEDIENVAIEGGIIDGGQAKNARTEAGEGDKVICVRSGRKLRFKNIHHRTGAHFVYLLNDCEQVTMNSIVIKKTRDAVNLINCRDVALSHCNFTGCADDAVAIKSDFALGRNLSNRNIHVWDCTLESNASTLQFGSESIGNSSDVYFWDITITRAGRAGISITSNDGGNVENVHYKNIKMRHIASPIFMQITHRLRTPRDDAKPGTIRNISFDKIVAVEMPPNERNPAFAATLSGLPKSHIQNVRMNNVKITYKGGQPESEASVVPGYPKRNYYPRGMGARPASGLYARHVDNLIFHDLTIAFEKKNTKSPLVFFDAHDLLIERLTVPKPPANEPIRLHRVTNFSLSDSEGFAPINHAEIDMPMPFRLTSPTNIAVAAVLGMAMILTAGFIYREQARRIFARALARRKPSL